MVLIPIFIMGNLHKDIGYLAIVWQGKAASAASEGLRLLVCELVVK